MKIQLVTALVSLLSIARIFAQGDLNPPPGPPAPTMKTLDQLEPRTIVNAVNTPGDGVTQFIISAPGSYYLAGNLLGEVDKDGIRITADDVTLNLNGYVLRGNPGSRSGVVTGSIRNLALRGGTVRFWGYTGIEAGLASNSTFEQLRISNNGTGGPNFGMGISVGFGCILSSCVAMENSSDGLACNGTGVITGCVAQNNAGSGFNDYFPGGSSYAQCAASGNTIFGFASAGGSTFTACSARANTGHGFSIGSNSTITHCTASVNASGIAGVDTCTIANCTSTRNRDDGIVVFGGSLILNNTASVNGADGSGDGIRTINAGNRIDGNLTASNAFRGIRCLGVSPFDDIIRNTSTSNGVGAYAPSSAARMGPLGTPSTATSPWANF